jgi:hypothetical protein
MYAIMFDVILYSSRILKSKKRKQFFPRSKTVMNLWFSDKKKDKIINFIQPVPVHVHGYMYMYMH